MISVIVPIYNVEEVLAYCLSSIQKQTYTNIEVILVDDGSMDKSGLICDQFCQLDKRFRVIHKMNEGIAKARNVGVKEASGDYICFVDSDDMLHPQMLEKLFEALHDGGYDFSMCDYRPIEAHTEPMSALTGGGQVLEQDSLVHGLFAPSGIEMKYLSVCNKLYKRENICDVLFENVVSEDFDYNLKVFLKSKRATCVNDALYYYYQNPNSITHKDVIGNKLVKDRFVYSINTYANAVKRVDGHANYEAWALWKLYRRMFSVRYYAKDTKFENLVETVISQVHHKYWKKVKDNNRLSFKQKCFMYFFISFPQLYRTLLSLYISNKSS